MKAGVSNSSTVMSNGSSSGPAAANNNTSGSVGAAAAAAAADTSQDYAASYSQTEPAAGGQSGSDLDNGNNISYFGTYN